jgi:hypothetical protein
MILLDFVDLYFQMDCLDPLVLARVFATENLALGQETYAPYRWDHSGIEAVDGLNETIWRRCGHTFQILPACEYNITGSFG